LAPDSAIGIPRTTEFEANPAKLGFVFRLSFDKDGAALFDDVEAGGDEGAETTIPLLGDISLGPEEEHALGSIALRECWFESKD
jgi:hypothetical protein